LGNVIDSKSSCLWEAKMSEADGAAGRGEEQRIDRARREALTRFAKYTAPAMLAVLVSVAESRALIITSPIHKNPNP
jgi:hypothetical protein